MKRSLKFILPLAIFLGIAIFLYRGLSIDPHAIPSPLIDKPLPPFELPVLNQPGKTLSNKDLLGKVYLLNVWATWCVSCRAEHPTLVALSRAGLVDLYGIDWKDDDAAATVWLNQLGNPYQAVMVDKKGRTAIDLGVYGAPETFLVDKKGVIRKKYAGALSPALLESEILPLIEKLRAES